MTTTTTAVRAWKRGENYYVQLSDRTLYRVPDQWNGWGRRERLLSTKELRSEPWRLQHVAVRSLPESLLVPVPGRVVPDAGSTLTAKCLAARKAKAKAAAEAKAQKDDASGDDEAE